MATSTILLLTDAPERGKRLARDLEPLATCQIIDVLNLDESRTQVPGPSVRCVVSDASLASSATIGELRFHLERLKGRSIPYLCLLHEDTPRSRMQAIVLGATGILRADAAPQQVLSDLTKLLPREAPRGGCLPHANAARSVLTRMFEMGGRGQSIAPAIVAAGAREVEQAVVQAGVREWLDVVWQFDDATHQHCLLVAGLAAGFARQLGFTPPDCQRLTQAALLHDVGKSRVPLHILNKPGPLTPDEQRVMRTHPVAGVTLLAGGDFAPDLLAVVRSHHEYLDGSGYPDGLRGGAIPDLVRLVTVCDIFAALIERRPYRAMMSGDKAYALLTGMGDKLDQALVGAFRPLASASSFADNSAPA
ncbi:HD-GYP domain-containing protein [Methylobacterium isbiliense]|uniref:HD-GYP domain-containing protein n=1 Tax=Methylobacterium isbiliense TaxID=315478 RepID=A0ABQ4SIF4_9HYPH|nr:HD domain-containing phosphohydrolase [Methylobacterium isbiliense]MDN3627638.1 HD domain-containing protein [Methylobacterium isbiliense]GJE02218.1 hypothetical protein GMJLKIPL_4162 [Methylobacterium isbiliense]